MTSAAPDLPRWDMSVVYPSIESPEFEQGFRDLARTVADLAARFDASGIGVRGDSALDADTVRAFEAAIASLNAALDAAETMRAYLAAFVTTDSRDAVAQARQSDYQHLRVRLSQLNTRFTAWIGSLDVEALIAASDAAREHAYYLRRARTQAAHLMPPAEEALAAEMSLTGGSAWTELYGRITSQILVPIERDGKTVDLPMSAVRNLAHDADRSVRRQAHEAELAAWQRAAVPLAAALNGVKGEVVLLARRRKWSSPLEMALFDNGIDRAVLDAMLCAAREHFPTFRRYLRAKARALGLDVLSNYDLHAPLMVSANRWEFDRAADFILTQFGTYSTRLSGLAARAFRERWIDAQPRAGKRGGAYCMPLRGDESRVFANYQPVLSGVTTLAHELGHAYHNLNLASRPRLQRVTPMVLAETASTFCETIVRQAALRVAEGPESIALIDAELRDATSLILGVTGAFLFEQDLFERRTRRELSVDELNALVLAAQEQTYGDGVDRATMSPYVWAVQPQFYRLDFQFYNFPYTFGLLFGLGLYSRYLADPAGFRDSYDDLLSSTGQAGAATLAGLFGINLRDPEFWRSSLGVLDADVGRFEARIGELVATS